MYTKYTNASNNTPSYAHVSFWRVHPSCLTTKPNVFIKHVFLVLNYKPCHVTLTPILGEFLMYMNNPRIESSNI